MLSENYLTSPFFSLCFFLRHWVEITHWQGLTSNQRKVSGRKERKEKEKKKASPILELAIPILRKSQPHYGAKAQLLHRSQCSQECSHPPAVPHCSHCPETPSHSLCWTGAGQCFARCPWFHGKWCTVSRAKFGDHSSLFRQRDRLVRLGSTSPWPHCCVLAPGKLHTITVSLQLAAKAGVIPSVGIASNWVVLSQLRYRD